MIISVIIPVFRDWERLKTCLDLLAEQTADFDSFQVIVVNNDPSQEVPILNQTPFQLILVEEPSPGSYAARNKGIELSTGQALLFTDSDCRPTSNWISQAIQLLNSSPFDLFAGKIDVVGPAGNSFVDFDKAFAFPNERYVREENFGVTANLLVRKQVFQKIGGFNATLFTGGDSEFCNRAIREGFTITFSPDLIIYHPARESWKELKTKAIRFGGRLPKSESRLVVLAKLLGKFRIRTTDMKQIWGRNEIPFKQKLIFSNLRIRLRWVEAMESVQVFLGKTAGRK